MRRRAVFLLLMAGLPGPLAAQAVTDAAELARIDAAIARVQQELAGTREARGAVVAEIEASERLVLENQRQIAAVSAEFALQQAMLSELQERERQLRTEAAAQQELIAGYARRAWMSGNEEYLKLLLNQQDPARAARMLRYYRYFSAARADKLAAFDRTVTELAAVTADVAMRSAALERQRAELALRQDGLAASQQQRQVLLARFDGEVAAQDARLDQLEMERIEIEVLLQELQSSVTDLSLETDQEPFAARKGQLMWPLDGPHINSFGARHSLGDLTWEGVTIGASAGADVHAIHHGRVVFAGWFTTSGLLLIIDHGDGYMSLYAHNQELFKAVGEWVAAGDVIAAAGNTGGQRDASLYFEIRHNGRAENPASWCKPR